MKKYIKKIKYTLQVFKWFVWYNLWNGEHKKVWHLFMAMFKHVVFKMPYAVIIETSNTCNFNCPTCPTPHRLIFQKRQPEYMNLEKYKRIIDNVKDYVHIVYIYNSNEPLLHPDIVEMAKYASDNNLHTMLSTNCSLLDEKMTEKLLNSGLGEIRFALDSLKKEPFEKFRRGGNFETVKKNIEYFAGINKIDKLYIKPFILSGYAYNEEEIQNLSEQFFADKDIEDEAIVYKKDEHGLKPKLEYKKCADVKRVFTVLADGRAVMCCFDLYGDYVYGEMDKMDLRKMWNLAKNKKLRDAAYNRKFPLCKKCGNIE